MAAKMIERGSLLAKFHGAMVGAVVGDCLGAYFEGDYWHVLPKVEKMVRFFLALESTEDSRKAPKPPHYFTDDTAMARSVATSLIQHQSLDMHDMAERFVTEYNKEPSRGYGGSVGAVFLKLRDQNYAKPHGPAAEQFDGSGSYGNGGAMRISPAALFAYNYGEDDLNTLVDGITRITHSHGDALKGSKLQCAAVQLALKQNFDPEALLDCKQFLKQLQEWCAKLEVAEAATAAKQPEHGEENGSPQPRKKAPKMEPEASYSHKLRVIEDYLQREDDVHRHDIREELGNDVSALGSVPAAIYSFLRCTRPVFDIPRDNPFERTIIYAISLGGDTDTIATMAGAIAGAYYGENSIPQLWQRTCEGVQDAKDFADKLHDLQDKIWKLL